MWDSHSDRSQNIKCQEVGGRKMAGGGWPRPLWANSYQGAYPIFLINILDPLTMRMDFALS